MAVSCKEMITLLCENYVWAYDAAPCIVRNYSWQSRDL